MSSEGCDLSALRELCLREELHSMSGGGLVWSCSAVARGLRGARADLNQKESLEAATVSRCGGCDSLKKRESMLYKVKLV